MCTLQRTYVQCEAIRHNDAHTHVYTCVHTNTNTRMNIQICYTSGYVTYTSMLLITKVNKLYQMRAGWA